MKEAEIQLVFTLHLNPWLQDAKELLLSNQKNGDGSYLLRIGRDEKFVLSMKFRADNGQWDVEHFRIKRTNRDENT